MINLVKTNQNVYDSKKVSNGRLHTEVGLFTKAK